MQKKVLAAIYAIVKENNNIPLFPKNISGVTGCDENCVEEYFKEFEEQGYVKRKYPSFKVYTLTSQGLIIAEEAFRQQWQNAV